MNNNFEQTLENLLNGVENESTPQTAITEVPEMLPVVYEEVDSSDEDAQADYQFIRNNLYGLIGKANAALELTLKIAQMTESTSCVETAAGIIQASNNLSKTLLELHKKQTGSKAKEEKPKSGSGTTYNIQNNNFYNKEESDELGEILDQLDDKEKEV